MGNSELNRRGVLGGALAGAFALLALPSVARAEGIQRVVCAGADVTEIVARLAGVSVIQGVDSTSKAPAEVTKLPSIGYLRQISVEGILSLKPDLLIANRDLGPPTAVEQLRSTGLRIEIVSFPLNGEGMAAKIKHVGALLGREKDAEALAATVSATMVDVAKRLDGITSHPKIGFIRSIDGGTPMAGGKMGLVDATYALAGGANAFGDFPLFKPVSREVLAATPPDFVLADSAVVANTGGATAFLEQLGLTSAFAGKPDRLVETDLSTLFSFGPSAATQIQSLARRLHPDRFSG
ncbi:heme/hemin ABC transporter substrate-binding protein [Labrys neptuniae]|uniref:ABC transporter substrate-binding protein n=1 Tax=Labrys neptuniae TaxID=376174 RepID=A0ABV3PWH9_9HYPH